MPRSVTVDTFTTVIGVPVPRRGFAFKSWWLYEDGRIVGPIKEVIDEMPVEALLETPGSASTQLLGCPRGPFTFVFRD